MKLFVNLLKEQKRMGDARLGLETGLKINPTSKRLDQLADELGLKEQAAPRERRLARHRHY